jgi:hypothetical protein
MRLGKVDWEADRKILAVLKDNEIKATSDADKLSMHKQVARMYATDIQKKFGNAERIINEFILPLYDDFDLISFRDNKENNLLHCCLKTFQAKDNFTLNFFNSGMVNEFVPKDLDP